jgi:hypothetical protein
VAEWRLASAARLEQRHKERVTLLVCEEEKANDDLASMLGDSQRIRRLRWWRVGRQVAGSAKGGGV